MKITQFDDFYKVAKSPMHVMTFEQHIYTVAQRLTKNAEHKYDGGYWKSVKFVNQFDNKEAFAFLLDDKKNYEVCNEMNGSSAELSSKAFSLACFLIALSEMSMHLASKHPYEDALVNAISSIHSACYDSYQILLEKKELSAFYSIID